MSRRVLAFDIGVKNLAFAIVTEDRTVHALENTNLLEPVEPIRCSIPACTHLATYRTPTAPYCKRHLPKTHTVLPELSKKKLPIFRCLKELVKEHYPASPTPLSVASALAILHTRFALPVQQPKQEAVAKLSLESIHDALRSFTEERGHLFEHTTHVLLENQPAFKNPHMKSVQVLLFATLREWFIRSSSSASSSSSSSSSSATATPTPPPFHLVHAKKKVVDAPKGDIGYSERKQKSEERVRQLFDTGKVTGSTHYEAWKGSKKKSDMADALCMAIDFLGSD